MLYIVSAIEKSGAGNKYRNLASYKVSTIIILVCTKTCFYNFEFSIYIMGILSVIF